MSFVDADWGNSIDDRKSYTEFIFLLSEAIIAWESRKQKTTTSTEAEYMAFSECSKEATYLISSLKLDSIN